MRVMQVMIDMVMDLLDRMAREAASILELEGRDTVIIDDQHRRKTRLSRRQGLRECMPSFPGDEPRALCLIKVHSIHELDGRDASTG
jgi:hypothetical protein